MIFGGAVTTGPYCTDDSLRIALAGALLAMRGSAATSPRPAITSSTVSGGCATPSALAARETSTMPRAVRTPTWSTLPSRKVVKVMPFVALATSAALAAATSVGAATVAAAVPARNAPRDDVMDDPPDGWGGMASRSDRVNLDPEAGVVALVLRLARELVADPGDGVLVGRDVGRVRRAQPALAVAVAGEPAVEPVVALAGVQIGRASCRERV